MSINEATELLRKLLQDDEICFYDALAQHDTAVDLLGIDELKVIATELVMKVRDSVTIFYPIRRIPGRSPQPPLQER